MHLVVALPGSADDREIAAAALRRGLSVTPLSSCYLGRPRRRGLLLGYGTTRVAEIPDAVQRLKAIL